MKTGGRAVFENLGVECLRGACCWLIGGDWPAPSNTGNLGMSHPLARVSRLHLEKPQLGLYTFVSVSGNRTGLPYMSRHQLSDTLLSRMRNALGKSS